MTKKLLIKRILHKSAIKAAAHERYLPGWFEADLFDQFPVAEINIGCRAGALFFHEIAQFFHKLGHIVGIAKPQSIWWVSDNNCVFKVFDFLIGRYREMNINLVIEISLSPFSIAFRSLQFTLWMGFQ